MANYQRNENRGGGYSKRAPRTKREKTRKPRPVYEYEIKVKRVLDGKYGVLFDLELNHVTIYGCRMCETRDGEAFVGFPRKRDRNEDRYWSICYAPLTQEQQEEVIRQVSIMLDGGDPDEEQEEEETEE